MPKYFFYGRVREFAKNTVYIPDKCEFLYHFLFQMEFKSNHVIFTADLVQLVAKKNGNCQNKFDTFLHFFYSVKPSYEEIG
jgi:hypothetical protein